MVSREKDNILFHAITNELARGTKHYNRAGKELKSVKEVLMTLRDEGEIIFEPPKDVPSVIIDPKWHSGPCPSCHELIYIDEVNKRTYHKAPLCKWYKNFTSKAYCEGEIDLIIPNPKHSTE
jgi:hypothetical protein